ncbi:uncharacterized protein [Dysidea avara]
MTYGVDALPLLREEVEDCPATSATLLLTDDFCELNDKNHQFICYVKLYLTTEELIVARKKICKDSSPAFTFSRVHRFKDVTLEKEEFLNDVMVIVDNESEERYMYQVHFTGDIHSWLTTFERVLIWNSQPVEINTEVCATNGCVKRHNFSGQKTPVVLWNRADCQCLNSSARSCNISCSGDLASHLATPVRSRLSSVFNRHSRLDESPSPELQELGGIDLDNMSMHDEDNSRQKTSSSLLQAWSQISSDEYVTATSELDSQANNSRIRTLDTAVWNKGHTRNKSTSVTRGVQIMSRSNSTVSATASDPGADPRVDSGMVVESGLAYTNHTAVLRSVSCDCQPGSFDRNLFLASPLRHKQIRGKKVKFSPRQNMLTTSLLPVDDDSEQCLIFENGTLDHKQDHRNCATPESLTPPEDGTPITPTRSVPTTKHEKGGSLGFGVMFTPPKRKLVSRLFRRRTTSSISDVDDLSRTEMESPETSKPLKKKLHQMDPKLVASQLVLIDAEMLRKIKLEELKGGAWVGKNKETRAPNVLTMVQAFNRLALLVPTEILEERTPTARAKVMAAYIQIADKCRSVGNYNSLKAILAGLQCTPIYRLKKTWKEVSGRRKKKFEDLSRLMSEEDNWKTYKNELKEVMSSKNLCVPFLGQFLTQIVQQETVNDLKSYRRKSRGRRPQSGEFNSGSHETLSAPASPVNSFHEDQLELSPVTSPSTMNPPAQCERKTSAPSDILNHVENSVNKKDDTVDLNLKLTSGSSIVERRDKLSPLPVGKFKKNPLSNNLYRDSFRKSSPISAMKLDGAVGQDVLSPEDVSMLSVISPQLKRSCDSLDSLDSSNYSRGSTPPRDIHDELDGSFMTCPLSPLDVSHIEVSIEDSVTPCEEMVRESTPVENSNLNGEASFNGKDMEVSTIERGAKKTSSFGLKKKRWSSLKRKVSSPIGDSSSSTSCSDAGPQKRDNKLHIYDMDSQDVHMMLQQIQFSSLGYTNSLECRQDIKCFIEGLHFNSEEENYHNSLEVEPNDQPLY